MNKISRIKILAINNQLLLVLFQIKGDAPPNNKSNGKDYVIWNDEVRKDCHWNTNNWHDPL